MEQALRIARRRKWVILQAVVIVPVLAYIFTSTQPKEYTASSTLLFRQPPSTLETNSGLTDPTREAATNGELVALPVVAEETAKALGSGYSGAEILADVEVSPSPEAETATVSATTEDPQRSATIATAYAQSYIKFRRKADRAQVQEAINLAEQSLNSLGTAEREGPQGEKLTEQLDQLKLTQALQTGGAELVQPASPPSSPSAPHPTKNVALGVVIGLLLGFGLALLLERIDRRIRTIDELISIYDLPVLARIPRSKKLARRSLQVLGGSTTIEGEAFRVLRTNLRFFDSQEKRSILVVSPEQGDGKTTVARGLATTMAEMGDRVALVDTDLRKGGEIREVQGNAATGLSNVLTGMPLSRVLTRVDLGGSSQPDIRSLALLPSGPQPPNPAQLLESGRMVEILEELHETFDVVVLDSPAIGAVSDALALVPVVSDIIVVSGLGKTTRDAAGNLHQQFELVTEEPVGIVVNFTDVERAKHSYYHRPESATRGNSVE